jgi:hypothetical protein
LTHAARHSADALDLIYAASHLHEAQGKLEWARPQRTLVPLPCTSWHHSTLGLRFPNVDLGEVSAGGGVAWDGSALGAAELVYANWGVPGIGGAWATDKGNQNWRTTTDAVDRELRLCSDLLEDDD